MIRTASWTIVCLGCFAVVASVATAQSSLTVLEQPLVALEQPLAALEQNVQAMDRWLGQDENANRWRRYLRHDLLQQQMQLAGQADIDKLNDVLAIYESDTPGLHCTRFRRVSSALASWRDTIAAQQVQPVSLRPAPETISVEEVIPAQAVIHQATLPNLYARFSERLVAASVSRPVNQIRSVAETILGTPVRGRANTVGQVTADIVPSRDGAAIDLHLTGTAHSNTVGTERRFQVFTRGVTSIDARKRLHLRDLFVTTSPAWANCRTHTRTTGIGGARLGLVQRLVRRGADEKRPAAQNVVSRRTERRVARNMDQDAIGSISRANASLQTEIAQPLRDRGLYPNMLKFTSDHHYVFVKSMLQLAGQSAANNMPPHFINTGDVAAQVHESVIANAGAELLGGKEITDERVVELLEENNREVPEELQITEDKDPWSITFPAGSPVTAGFAGGLIKISIRADEFKRGNRTVGSPLEVTASYNPQIGSAGLQLQRDGDVQVDFLREVNGTLQKQPRLSITQTAFKRFIQRKFESLFKEEFEFDGIELSGELAKAGRLQVSQIQADQGWLSVSLHQQPQHFMTTPVAIGEVVLTPHIIRH